MHCPFGTKFCFWAIRKISEKRWSFWFFFQLRITAIDGRVAFITEPSLRVPRLKSGTRPKIRLQKAHTPVTQLFVRRASFILERTFFLIAMTSSTTSSIRRTWWSSASRCYLQPFDAKTCLADNFNRFLMSSTFCSSNPSKKLWFSQGHERLRSNSWRTLEPNLYTG